MRANPSFAGQMLELEKDCIMIASLAPTTPPPTADCSGDAISKRLLGRSITCQVCTMSEDFCFREDVRTRFVCRFEGRRLGEAAADC